MAEGLKAVESFNASGEPSVVAAKWERWRKSFKFYIAALGNVADARQKALLLHCGGQDIQDIFELFTWADDVTSDTATFAQTLAKFDAHFAIHRNDTFERNLFRQMIQQDGESTAQFVTRLRQQARHCSFHDVNEMIRDQVIEKCTDKRLKTELFKRQNLTLDVLLKVAQAHELATGFVNKLNDSGEKRDSESVNFARGTKNKAKPKQNITEKK